MEFLYCAYRQLILSETSKSTTTRTLEVNEIELMKKCSEFKLTKGTTRPQNEGNDLSDTEINQLAKAYTVLSSRNILKSNSKTMNEQELKAMIAKYTAELEALNVAKTEETPVVEEVKEEVVVEEVKAIEEVVVAEETKSTEEVIIEEVIPVTEETIVTVEPIVVEEDAEKSVEESIADTTKNNTSIDESLLKSITSAIEIAIKSESEKTNETLALMEKSINEKIASLEELNNVSKSLSETKDKELNEQFSKFATAIKLVEDTVKGY
jgi:hypothetical protein